ncbi:MAG: RNA polymerase sigma factor [Vulcanimicrobiaceae bacterium]
METSAQAPERAFGDIIRDLRPKLHRYCARMTGSVIDGEDVLQDAFVKAFSAFSRAGRISNVESWLFRIAHNASLDFLRRRSRHDDVQVDEDIDRSADPLSVVEDRETVATSLRTFMRLPLVQRSSVILMDVLDTRYMISARSWTQAFLP